MHITVPFKIDKVYAGFGEAHGILTFNGERLLMEFQTKDAESGEVKIPVSKKHYADLQTLEAEINSVKTNRSLDQLLAESHEFLSQDSSSSAPPPPPPPA